MIHQPCTVWGLKKWIRVNLRTAVYRVSRSFSSQRVCVCGRRSSARTYTKQKPVRDPDISWPPSNLCAHPHGRSGSGLRSIQSTELWMCLKEGSLRVKTCATGSLCSGYPYSSTCVQYAQWDHGTPSHAKVRQSRRVCLRWECKGEVKDVAAGSHVDQGLKSSRIQNGVVDLDPACIPEKTNGFPHPFRTTIGITNLLGGTCNLYRCADLVRKICFRFFFLYLHRLLSRTQEQIAHGCIYIPCRWLRILDLSFSSSIPSCSV